MNCDNECKLEIEKLIKQVFSEVLNITPKQLKDDVTFDQYGVDSLIVMDINKRLESYFGSLPTTLLFECRNLEQLTNYFLENYSQECIKIYEDTQVDNNNEKMNKSEVNDYKKDSNDIWKKKEPIKTEGRSLLENFYNQLGKHSVEESTTEKDGDIAIIGVSGRYPNSPNLNMFWENLKKGNNCITEIPKERWNWEEYYDSDVMKKGSSYSKWGGFIDGIDEFDPLFFNISPREAEAMDPQERLMLETAWATMEDAGYTSKKIKAHQQKVGVFVGAMNADYEFIAGEQFGKGNLTGAHSSFWSMANRISYLLDLQGPSYTIDTACSSSLTALHLACSSIKNNECEVALVGGVNLILHPVHFIRLCGMNMLSKDDRLKSFGVGADGFVDGEGVGAVLLKPLSKAKRDHDCIRGIIKASWINTGGKTNGYTVPNPIAQADLVKSALKEANISPNTISYIEAHGTGTELGDPIEIAGLTRAYSMADRKNENTKYCAVGSVKSNIGHLESAAGIASITKVLLMMKHKQLVPTINCETLNKGLNIQGTPFYIERECEDWKLNEGSSVRRAGISSFGAGGANAHLILEEYRGTVSNNLMKRDEYLFVISAKTKHQVKKYAECLIKYFEEESNIKPWDIAYTLQTGREAMVYRIAVLAHNVEELTSYLRGYLADEQNEYIFEGEENEVANEFSFMMKDEDYKELLENWMKKKKYQQLANLWVKGAEIDWNCMYEEENRPYIIPLPTYQFENKKYWIKVVNSKMQLATTQEMYAPLLQRKNEYPLLKQVIFESNLNSNSVSYIKDHKINGEYIISGSAYLTMAMDAVGKECENKETVIEKVIFHKPFVIKEQTPNSLQFYLTGENSESKSFKVARICESQDYELNVVGKISSYKEQTQTDTRLFEQALTSEYVKVEKDEFYNVLRQQNIELGMQYRWLEKLYAAKGKAIVKLKRPDLQDDAYQSKIHPGMIDSLFQASSLTLYGNDITADTYLPYSIQKFSVLGEITDEELWASLKLKSADYDNGEMIFDMDVYQNKYKVIEVRGFLARKISRQKPMRYKVAWEKNCAIQVNLDKKTYVVFTESGADECKIVQGLKQKGNQCYIISPGNAYEKNSEDRYTISFEDPEDYKRILENLKYDEIIYAWGMKYKRFELSIDTFEQQKNYSIKGLLFLIQGLGKKSKDLILRTVTRCTQQVDKRRITINTAYSALKGICLAAAYEYPNLKIQTIDMDNTDTYDNVINEIISHYSENIIAFRDGERYVARLEQVKTDLMQYERVSLDCNKCYMVTGGFGALGILTAEWLTNNGAKNILLIGRSEPSEQVLENIKSMQSKGVNIQVINADVSSKEALKQVFEQLDHEKIALGGIIHSAGYIDDAYILNQTMSKIEKVIAPKVKGLLNLHELTLERTLDFFVCYSSASSLIGSQGQLNYIVANSVMDSIMQQRNYMGLPGTSINWGAWNRGLPKKEPDIYNYYDVLGMGMLEEKDIDVLAEVLICKEPQLGVLKVDWEKILNILPDTMKDHYFYNFCNDGNEISNIITVNSVDVKAYVCELLGFSEEDIPLNEPLIKLGLDSISASEIIHFVNSNTQANMQVVQLLQDMTLSELLDELKNENNQRADEKKKEIKEEEDLQSIQTKSMTELSELVDNINILSNKELDELLLNLQE